METILALTDFSDTSLHAAEYAALLADRFGAGRLIIANTYRILAPATDIPLEPGAGEDLREASLNSLRTFRQTLDRKIPEGNITIQLISMEADLVEAVNEIGKTEAANLVVMGMTGRSGTLNILMGSNSSRLLKGCRLPLLIVPKTAPLVLPTHLALATDLREIKGIPATLTFLLERLQPELSVVNVGTGGEAYKPEMQKGITELHKLLDRYGARYNYINAVDIADGINTFVRAHGVSLVIAIHGSHTGLSGLFHKSVSKKLASHIEVPLLIVTPGEKT